MKNKTMRWLVFLWLTNIGGTFAMEITKSLGINVWLARGTGMLACLILAVVLYHILKMGGEEHDSVGYRDEELD